MLCYVMLLHDMTNESVCYGMGFQCYAMAYIVKDMLKLTVLIVKAT